MLETISNEDEIKGVAHSLKIKKNELLKICKENGIPVFMTYYIPGQGYLYDGLFPEEITNPKDKEGNETKDLISAVKSEYWRFTEFLKTVIGFNKEDYKPVIRKNTERRKSEIEKDDFEDD